MNILAIETSCDETAVAIIQAKGKLHDKNGPQFRVLGNSLMSQVNLHAKYGGVFPALAKREHTKNIIPIFIDTLKEANMYTLRGRVRQQLVTEYSHRLITLFAKESELLQQFLEILPAIKKPKIDAIAVTYGPGLEPALWVGINFARALALVWNLPLIPVNHMHGHIAAGLFNIAKKKTTEKMHNTVSFPVLALLISGGHTELVHMPDWGSFVAVGKTRDDAVGEAFDKVARMLNLPYPGGPEISTLANEAREKSIDTKKYLPAALPRPMMHSGDCDFSFSGLKTAVFYSLRSIPKLTKQYKRAYALALEDAITDVLIAKTKKALEQTNAETLVLGGGVSANIHIRKAFKQLLANEFPHTKLALPEQALSTDNAIMIGKAAYCMLGTNINLLAQKPADITAQGNARL